MIHAGHDEVILKPMVKLSKLKGIDKGKLEGASEEVEKDRDEIRDRKKA